MTRTGSIPRILGLLREELPALSAGTVLLVAGAGLSLVYPQGIRAIVDGAIAGRDPAHVTRIALFLAALAVFQGAAIAGRSLLFSLAGERGVRRVRERLYASLIAQEVGFFDASRTGELVSRLGTDCATLQSLLSAQISMTFRHVITALGGLVLLFITSPRLTVVMLLVVPPVAIGAVAYGGKVRALARLYQDALADASHVAEESLSAIRTVRAFVAEDAERARYKQAVDDAYDSSPRRSVPCDALVALLYRARASCCTRWWEMPSRSAMSRIDRPSRLRSSRTAVAVLSWASAWTASSFERAAVARATTLRASPGSFTRSTRSAASAAASPIAMASASRTRRRASATVRPSLFTPATSWTWAIHQPASSRS